jgi:hypothetical protein
VLFVFVHRSFNSDDLIAEVAMNQKDVVGVLLPGQALPPQDMRQLREFCWHFAHDPHLAFISLTPRPTPRPILLVRTSALLALAPRLGSFCGELPRGHLKLEQLFDIDPVERAYDDFVAALRQKCTASGFSYRVTSFAGRTANVGPW